MSSSPRGGGRRSAPSSPRASKLTPFAARSQSPPRPSNPDGTTVLSNLKGGGDLFDRFHSHRDDFCEFPEPLVDPAATSVINDDLKRRLASRMKGTSSTTKVPKQQASPSATAEGRDKVGSGRKRERENGSDAPACSREVAQADEVPTSSPHAQLVNKDLAGKFRSIRSDLGEFPEPLVEDAKSVFSADLLERLNNRVKKPVAEASGSICDGTAPRSPPRSPKPPRCASPRADSTSVTSDSSDDGSSDDEDDEDTDPQGPFSGDFFGFVGEKDDLEEYRSDVPPWAKARYAAGYKYSDNPVMALHQEATDLLDFLRPTPAEVHMRRKIEMEIREIAFARWPNCEPCVYGSMSSKLLLPGSDIDVSLLNIPEQEEEALTYMASEISKRQLCFGAFPQMILKTKVPLVKFLHRNCWLDVDLSCNAGDGKVTTEIVRQLLKEFPVASKLITLVKYFLVQRDMAEPYRGGLGSYAVILLVVSFLQHHPAYAPRSHRGRGNGDAEDLSNYGLGRLLVEFFRYYSGCYNYQRIGISVSDGGMYFDRPSGQIDVTGRGPQQMLIEDPGNPQNNVASSVRQFHAIQHAFDHAFKALTATFQTNDLSDSKHADHNTARIDRRPTILSRIFHADPALMQRRQKIFDAYDTFVEAATQAEIDALHDFKAEEDAVLFTVPPKLPKKKRQRESGKRKSERYSQEPQRDSEKAKKKKKNKSR